MAADLVVLPADPEHDATAFSKVRYTILNGKLIYSEKGSLKRVRNPSSKSGYLRDQKAVTWAKWKGEAAPKKAKAVLQQVRPPAQRKR